MATMWQLWSLIFIYEHFVNGDIVCDRNRAHDNSTTHYDSGLYRPTRTAGNGTLHITEALATTADFVRKYGYPVETHTVTTEDGYLLTVFRISGSPRAAASGVKTPVLIIHGLFCCSDGFVQMGPDRSLGFLLADQGYDVWMGNTRGNFYSRKHVTLSSRDPKFWNFSFHEMGVYDCPAMIDYVLKTTNQKQLIYIGHSMGGNVFFVLTSMKPEYNKKIRLGVNMGPSIFTKNLRLIPLELILNNFQLFHLVTNAMGMYQLIPRSRNLQLLQGQMCREGSPELWFCMFIYRIGFGLNQRTFDTKTSHILFSHLLSGSSFNTVAHFAQNHNTDRFQMFDHTMMGKKTKEYNLSLVSAPVYIQYAENDDFVRPEAVMRLCRQLPNLVGTYRVPDIKASHMDFVFSKHVKHDIYDELLKVVNQYSK